MPGTQGPKGPGALGTQGPKGPPKGPGALGPWGPRVQRALGPLGSKGPKGPGAHTAPVRRGSRRVKIRSRRVKIRFRTVKIRFRRVKIRFRRVIGTYRPLSRCLDLKKEYWGWGPMGPYGPSPFFSMFIAFNYLEANLPSLLTKQLPAEYKGTGSGVFATCQFLGAALGGIVSGGLYQYWGVFALFVPALLLMLFWLIYSRYMVIPIKNSRV